MPRRLERVLVWVAPAVVLLVGVVAPRGAVARTMVRDRKEGTRRLYSVDPRGVEELRRYLEGFWDTALVAFRDAAEGSEAVEPGAKGSRAKGNRAKGNRKGAKG